MTDETKKLFEAPYKVCETRNGYNVICTNKVLPQLCWTTDKKDANRISCLPELYDALNKQAYYRCVDCLRHTANTIDDIPLNRDMIEHGCPKNRTDCGAFDAWKLLKKVRDGE